MTATFPMSKYSMVELMATKAWRVKNEKKKDGTEKRDKPETSTCQICMQRLRDSGKITILARRGSQTQLTFGKTADDKMSFLLAKVCHVCGNTIRKTIPLKVVSVPLPPPPTPQASPTPPPQPRLCKCGNALPMGRDVFCYTCRPSRVKVPS